MAKRLYVGNLPFSANEAELRALFERHGTVQSCSVIIDRETGRSRGFAFVEMDEGGADAAIRALDGADMNGRRLRVNEAHEREQRGGGGGGRPGGGGGGGGGFRDRDRRPR
ncbi:MAG TPA: RNA-binding protein [Myxococcota bacterium]|nr:RNA-binding protein [Myxococcota bacterium]